MPISKYVPKFKLRLTTSNYGMACFTNKTCTYLCDQNRCRKTWPQWPHKPEKVTPCTVASQVWEGQEMLLLARRPCRYGKQEMLFLVRWPCRYGKVAPCMAASQVREEMLLLAQRPYRYGKDRRCCSLHGGLAGTGRTGDVAPCTAALQVRETGDVAPCMVASQVRDGQEMLLLAR